MSKLSELSLCKVPIHDKSKGASLGYFTKKYYIYGHYHELIFEGIQVGYGIRAFIVCPICNSRCNLLYTVNPYFLEDERQFGKKIACRKCWNFNYLSQQATKTKWQYETHKMLYYGMSVDRNFKLHAGIDTPFPAKPNDISWHNYFKNYRKYNDYKNIANMKWLKRVSPFLKRNGLR